MLCVQMSPSVPGDQRPTHSRAGRLTGSFQFPSPCAVVPTVTLADPDSFFPGAGPLCGIWLPRAACSLEQGVGRLGERRA